MCFPKMCEYRKRTKQNMPGERADGFQARHQCVFERDEHFHADFRPQPSPNQQDEFANGRAAKKQRNVLWTLIIW